MQNIKEMLLPQNTNITLVSLAASLTLTIVAHRGSRNNIDLNKD